MTTTTQHSTFDRLVNVSVAYLVTNRYGQHVETAMGAYGVPEEALAYAATLPAVQVVEGVTFETVGAVITDVRTGEKWLVRL